MTTFLGKENNAQSLLVTAIDDNDLSVVVTTGEGTKFPSSGQFIITIWDNDTYPNAPTSDPNMEAILMDSISTDTMTVNASGRGYAGTSAGSHGIGSAVALLIMKEHFTEIQDAVNTLETFVGARAYLSADQDNITASTNTTVTLDSEDYDIGGNFNNGTYKFVAPVAGYYFIYGQIRWEGSEIQDQISTQARIHKNGLAGTLVSFGTTHTSGTAMQIVSTSCRIHLNAGDTIELVAWHNSGGAAPDIDGGIDSTYLEVILFLRD